MTNTGDLDDPVTNEDNTMAEEDETLRLDADLVVAEIPRKYAVSIIIRSGPKKGAEYTITGGRTIIGRGTGADIILDEATISRMHAAIEYRRSKFFLRDLGSMNGTRVEGKSIKEIQLTQGDKFQIGDVVIEFVVMEKPGESVYVLE